MIEIYVQEIKQPIGSFYITSLPLDQINRIAYINPRQKGGIERFLSKKRVKEISKYCLSPDATFPTPIIIAIDENSSYEINNNKLTFDIQNFKGEVIDGQHRLEGIRHFLEKNTNQLIFELSIVFMFDLTDEMKAYVFSIINSKQTKVSKSHIYDLYDLSSVHSPDKVAHDMAKLLNQDEESAFYKRIKMLGIKEDPNAFLSQGAFAKYFLPLISKDSSMDEIHLKRNQKLEDDPSCPLRKYYLSNQDEVIYKILFNLFNALRDTFSEEWANPQDYILTKTIGYAAVMKAFPIIYENGFKKKKLTHQYFYNVFLITKNLLKEENLDLTSEFFSANLQNINRLSSYFKRSTENS